MRISQTWACLIVDLPLLASDAYGGSCSGGGYGANVNPFLAKLQAGPRLKGGERGARKTNSRGRGIA